MVRSLFLVAAVLVTQLTVPLAAANSEAPEPTDFEKIQGVWQAALIEADGKSDPEAASDNVRFVFESDLVTTYQGGKRTGAYRFAIDSKKPLPEVDLGSADNPTPDTSKKGIYRLQEGSLELCMGDARPSQFRGVDGAELYVFQRPPPEDATAVPVWCLDFSPNGQQLAMAGGERDGRGVITLLNAKDWSIAFSRSEQRAATCVAFSPHGDKLAIGTQLGEVAILDLKTRAVENRWHSGKWAVFGITWTHDNRDVIAACANGVIKQFCAGCGSLRTTFDTWQADGVANPKLGGHSDRNLWDVAVTRDAKTLLSGGWNGTTRLWNMTTGEQEQAFSTVDHSTQGVKFTADERHFVSNGIGGKGCIVRATDSREIRADLDAAGRDVAVHPEEQLFAASTLRDVRIFRLNLGEPTDLQRVVTRRLANRLAGADEKTYAEVAEELKDIGLPAETVLERVSRTAEGELLERIKQIQAEIKSAKPIATLEGHEGEVRQVVFSPTGNFLATSTITGDVRLWNPESFQLEHNLTLKLNP